MVKWYSKEKLYKVLYKKESYMNENTFKAHIGNFK